MLFALLDETPAICQCLERFISLILNSFSRLWFFCITALNGFFAEVFFGEPSGIRTLDLLIKSQLLYQPLLLAIEYPYKIDGPVYCDNLVAEVSALDTILGIGLDHYEEEGTRSERAAEAATNAATNALEDAATGWIPYRSVLRRLTGATKHERAITKAYQRGRIRRAFLKGVGGAFQCPYPARPSSVEQPMLAPDGATRPNRS